MQNRNPEDMMNLGYDRLFKKVFADENNIDILESLLSIMLKVPLEELKGHVKLVNNEQIVENKNIKKNIVDIIAEIDLIINKRIIKVNLEANKEKGARIERNTLYAFGLLLSRYKISEDYQKEKPIIQFNFNEFDVDEKNIKAIHRYTLKNEYNHTLTNNVVIYHINIARCYEIWYNHRIESLEEEGIIKLCALMYASNKEMFSKCLEDCQMESVVKDKINEKVVTFNADEYEWAYYDKEQNERAIHNGDITLAREEGHKEGFKEGIEQGESNKATEIAKNMIKEALPLEMISKITGLSIKEIEGLNK